MTNTPVTLPCGCFLNPTVTPTGIRELRVSPCHPQCQHLADLLAIARQHHRPIEYGDTP